MQKEKAIYDTVRILRAISLFCITLIDMTGVLEAGSIFDDDAVSSSAPAATPGEIILFVLASVYLVLVGVRMARIIHSHIFAWALRFVDIMVIITLFIYLFNFLHS